MSEQTIIWQGTSGAQYKYWILPINTVFKEEPGNYIYSKQNASGKWMAVYIGQTESLRQRLASHERELEAKRFGATHIHVHTSPLVEGTRLDEEGDLIRVYKPPMNSQVS